ncbi:MAG: radical SAM protein, partial [Synechococcaceae cyanobacterium ELA182]
VMEKLATCLCLIEIVHSCNLACPTCYADSPAGAGAHVDAVPLDDLRRRIQGVIDRKGGIEILQLSGGEPTLHPQFFELLEWLQEPSRSPTWWRRVFRHWGRWRERIASHTFRSLRL